MRAALDQGEWALLSRARYARDLAADSLRYAPVLSSGQWRLVHAAPAPPATVGPSLD